MCLNRILNNFVNLVNSFIKRLVFWLKVFVPVLGHFKLTVFISEVMPLWKTVNTLKESFLSNWVLECHVWFKRFFIKFLLKVRMIKKCLNFRPNKESTVHFSVIQWFNSKMVTGTEHFFSLKIPDNKAKHSAQLVNNILAPFFISVQDYFSIGMCLKCVTLTD